MMFPARPSQAGIGLAMAGGTLCAAASLLLFVTGVSAVSYPQRLTSVPTVDRCGSSSSAISSTASSSKPSSSSSSASSLKPTACCVMPGSPCNDLQGKYPKDADWWFYQQCPPQRIAGGFFEGTVAACTVWCSGSVGSRGSVGSTGSVGSRGSVGSSSSRLSQSSNASMSARGSSSARASNGSSFARISLVPFFCCQSYGNACQMLKGREKCLVVSIDRDWCTARCLQGGSSSRASLGLLFTRLDASSSSRQSSMALCGNGRIDVGEACDDGNRNNNDACTNDCRRGRGEMCLRQSDCGSLHCRDGVCGACGSDADCPPGHSCTQGQCVLRCGNGMLDQGEECDDGNLLDADGCSSNCKLEGFEAAPLCGNGLPDPGEACDEGAANGIGGVCTKDCLRANQLECRDNAECASRLCVNGRCAACTVDSQCPFGYRCDERGACVPGSGLVATLGYGGQLEGRTGPTTIALMTAGAAVGFAWMRRRSTKKRRRK